MSEQLTFVDALRARDDGIRRVDEHADGEWKEMAWAFLVAYLRDHEEFFADDLWEAGLPETRENRALGPLVLRAARAGYIEKTGRTRPSARKSHLSPGNIWRSLIYRPERGQ